MKRTYSHAKRVADLQIASTMAWESNAHRPIAVSQHIKNARVAEQVRAFEDRGLFDTVQAHRTVEPAEKKQKSVLITFGSLQES